MEIPKNEYSENNINNKNTNINKTNIYNNKNGNLKKDKNNGEVDNNN